KATPAMHTILKHLSERAFRLLFRTRTVLQPAGPGRMHNGGGISLTFWPDCPPERLHDLAIPPGVPSPHGPRNLPSRATQRGSAWDRPMYVTRATTTG